MSERIHPAPSPLPTQNGSGGDVHAPNQDRAPGALLLEGVTVRFGGTRALHDVSFSVSRGEILAIIGPNGAGKTTLFDVISGVIRPETGRVVLNDRDMSRAHPEERAHWGLRRTFQRVQTFGWLSVEDNVLLALESEGGGGGLAADMIAFPTRSRREKARRARVREMLERCGLDAVRSELAGSLPIGLARMVELARSLIADPKVLLLDEPSSGLDHEEAARLIRVIQDVKVAEECAVLLVEHDVGFVMTQSDRIVVLNLGEILAIGSPHEIQGNAQVRAAYLGDET